MKKFAIIFAAMFFFSLVAQAQEERLLENGKKFSPDIAITIYGIEQGKFEKPWWWFGDYMVFLEMTFERYGAEITNNLLRGIVKLGYTSEMCEVAWGEPDENNKTTLPWCVHEQWVYKERKAYLYFEDGKLVTIQD